MTREEAIKYIKSRCIGSTEERDGTQWSEAMWMAIEALADRPTGEWVENHNGTFTCDQCGCKHSKSNYCPNCGAKMRGEQDGNT